MTLDMDGHSFAEISEIYCIVFISFIILTFCIVLGIFKRQGLTPVIRLSSQSSIMDYEMPGTVMVGVSNPYVLRILQPEKATLKDGVQLKLESSISCKITSFWGLDCEVLKNILCIRKKRLIDADCMDILTDKAIAVNPPDYLEPDETKVLHLMTCALQNDGDQLGPPPRRRYPLVIIVTATENQLEAEQSAAIESLVGIIHLPDAAYSVPCHMISQLLQTNTKHVYDLQRMYIAADSNAGSNQIGNETEKKEETLGDCTVCQTARITRVILPCKHACCCDSCFPLLNMCPICRGYICSYFRLGKEPGKEDDEVIDDNSLLGRFYKFNDWLNTSLGFT
ncbi:cell growth regulator with RING finger domain protein 1-like [Anneissia japonica]|uniref:cell growth regulator with RING finger domain protein 1-like n=1 Tax=Anneissia japonica TaxID=1529436 RepID=UPI001425A250|nr:cell growth regulator with RING finger domain protein 1-like [Anneissia japonica]